jgi:hypothetical protein
MSKRRARERVVTQTGRVIATKARFDGASDGGRPPQGRPVVGPHERNWTVRAVRSVAI